jgi:hypothetical protein
MGGVLLTTGLYDQNFFGNPARATANPKWRVGLLDVTVEASNATFSTASSLVDGKDVISKLAEHAGDNNHARIQTAFPSLYLPNVGGGKWSYQFAPLLLSLQADAGIRRSYSVSPNVIADVGPAFTVARKFRIGPTGSARAIAAEKKAKPAKAAGKDAPLDEAKSDVPAAPAAEPPPTGDEPDNLSVGVTAHATYRVATRSDFGLVDLIRGQSFGVKDGGDGAHLEFDLGSTYLLPMHPAGLDLEVAAAINNLLGGNYSNLSKGSTEITGDPVPQPRSFGAGFAVKKDSIGRFGQTVAALEFTDFGNNANGSLFRTVHLGAETRFSVLAVRLGLNQGYLAGGLGLDLKVLQLDLATYGEEMSLNVGGKEDRRYAVHLAFSI